jgi:hypothetical protein
MVVHNPSQATENLLVVNKTDGRFLFPTEIQKGKDVTVLPPVTRSLTVRRNKRGKSQCTDRNHNRSSGKKKKEIKEERVQLLHEPLDSLDLSLPIFPIH